VSLPLPIQLDGGAGGSTSGGGLAGSFPLVCLDANGFYDGKNDGPYTAEPNENKEEADVIWRYDMMAQMGVAQHNMCSCSLTAIGDILFVCTSNGVDESHINLPAPHAPSFMAVDKNSGKVLWTDASPGDNILHGQWSSPAYAVLGGAPQVLFGGGDGWLYSFDPQGTPEGKSKLLWKFDCNPKESKYVLGGRADREAVVAGVPEGRRDARRVPHHFLGYASDVYAGASQAVRLDDGNLGAVFGRALRAGQAAAAAAHADEIEGLVRHCELRAQMVKNPNDILRLSITRVWGAVVISVVVILALSLALIVYLVGIYNGLVSLRENVKVAWANIDVLLKQRHDELPKLVDACKRYMQFEQETLEKVMRARASVSLASSAGNVAAVGAAEQQLRAGVGRLFAVAENYPQLKTDETFKQLQGRIIALEESIADRRELYNDQVNLNNIRVNVFPDAVIARKYGFLPAQLLEFADEEKRDVNVGALFGT